VPTGVLDPENVVTLASTFDSVALSLDVPYGLAVKSRQSPPQLALQKPLDQQPQNLH
jgi:hypothetical protein